MNDVIIDETNIISIFHQDASGELIISKPFARQIYLISTSIAGLFYVDDIDELFEKIDTGSKLSFFREPKNTHDELAIIVKDNNNNKLGYVPRKENMILARLMDAGKLIYATVKSKTKDNDCMEIKMEIYMDD